MTAYGDGYGPLDCWASRFGETTTALELAPRASATGQDALCKVFQLARNDESVQRVADIKTADQLHLPTPEVAYHTIATKPTQIQQDMVKALSERASKVHSGAVSPDVDNMLKITRTDASWKLTSASSIHAPRRGNHQGQSVRGEHSPILA